MDTALSAGTIDLHYDPDLVQPVTCQPDPDQKFDLALCNPDYADGVVRFSLISANGVAGDMTLANVVFRAVGEPGAASVLSASAPTFNDSHNHAIPTSFTDGGLRIKGMRVYLPITR